MDATGYNLLFNRWVPDVPYSGAPSSVVRVRSADWDRDERPKSRTVPSSYHHVMPKGDNYGLMTLWDKLVATKSFSRIADPLLLAINNYADQYIAKNGQAQNFTDAELAGAKKIANQIRLNEIIHDPNSKLHLEHWECLAALYVWLPGNLFIGPTQRIDDPGSTLDEPAEHIVVPGRYNLLKGAYTDIGNYMANPAGGIKHAEAAYKKLEKIAKTPQYQTIAPFETTQWIWDSKNVKGRTVEGAQVKVMRR